MVGWKVYCRHVFGVCSWGQAKSSPLLAVDAKNPLLMKVAWIQLRLRWKPARRVVGTYWVIRRFTGSYTVQKQTCRYIIQMQISILQNTKTSCSILHFYQRNSLQSQHLLQWSSVPPVLSPSNHKVRGCGIMLTSTGKKGRDQGAALISRAWRTWMRQRQARQNTHSFPSQCQAALLIKPYPTRWIMQQLPCNPPSSFCSSPCCVQPFHPVTCTH